MGTDLTEDAHAESRARRIEAEKEAAEKAAQKPASSSEKAPDPQAQEALKGAQKSEAELAAERDALLKQGVTPDAAKKPETAAPVEATKPAPEASSPSPESSAPATSTSDEPEEGKEKGIMDELKDYFDAAEKSGESWFGAALSTMGYAMMKLWHKIKTSFGYTDEEEGDDSDDSAAEVQHFEELVGVSQGQKVPKSVLEQFQALEKDAEKKTWVDYAKTLESSDNPKYGGVPASTILAFAKIESNFNPTARPYDGKTKTYLSSAEGLGQFIDGTWAKFQAANPEFKDAKRSDPKASLCAIAWYCKDNGAALGVDAKNPANAGLLYEAHFAGAGGFKLIQEALKGETISVTKIPKSYRGQRYPSLGVPGPVSTYLEYAQLAQNLGGKVQSVADVYRGELSPTNA